MKQLEELKTNGISHLVEAARRGDHTLPQQMLDDYTAIEALAAEHTDRFGKVTDQAVLKQADTLTERLLAAKAWGNAAVLLVDHVQPAMDAFLAQLTADLKTAGRHADQPGVTVDMLDESDDVRAAIVRLHGALVPYGHLRASWEILRRVPTGALHDQLGLRSPLAEVGNLPAIVPDWDAAFHGRKPWPWPSAVFHVRMKWLLSHGAVVWVPTEAEHEDAWRHYNPDALIREAA
ncbi:hypothetical protein AB0C77_23455 [Streptomyces sp. NPDC048629]|uniref:hypothetical protein n=1 Tax=Streptomyces sp. NPDC048629 TaxID=3154824 RepID=UPI00343C1057